MTLSCCWLHTPQVFCFLSDGPTAGEELDATTWAPVNYWWALEQCCSLCCVLFSITECLKPLLGLVQCMHCCCCCAAAGNMVLLWVCCSQTRLCFLEILHLCYCRAACGWIQLPHPELDHQVLADCLHTITSELEHGDQQPACYLADRQVWPLCKAPQQWGTFALQHYGMQPTGSQICWAEVSNEPCVLQCSYTEPLQVRAGRFAAAHGVAAVQSGWEGWPHTPTHTPSTSGVGVGSSTHGRTK